MSAISTWSTTAASNNSASPDGFPEAMAPSGVNDSNREVMAAVRTQMENAEWFDWGHTPTFVSATSFTVPNDVTTTYQVGRRIKITDSSTLYGTIETSAYTTLTTVTVTMDSGSITSSISAVALGINSVTNPSIGGSSIKLGSGLQSESGALTVAAGGIVKTAWDELSSSSTSTNTVSPGDASGLQIDYTAIAGANPRLVTAVLDVYAEDASQMGFNVHYVLQYNSGSSWADLADHRFSIVATDTAGTDVNGRTTIVLRVWHTATDATPQYRVTHYVTASGTESSTIAAGGSLMVQEHKA